MRKLIALTAAAGLLVTLAACSTSAPTGTCTPIRDAGDASSTVTASGAFGADPDATFPTPLITTGVEVSALTTGDGATLFPGEYSETQVTLYNGETGVYMTSTSYTEAEAFLVRAGESSSELGYALECRTVGSRLAITATGADLYGFAGIAEGSVQEDASFVIIFDVQGAVPAKAYGVDQIPQQGMPAVVLAPSGAPGVTVPAEDPPTGLKINVLKEGNGAVLAEGETVYVHFLRVNWADPKSTTATKSTWADFGSPQEWQISDLNTTTGGGLIAGLKQAVVGQKVGSQVLAVIPPSFGFPDGATPPDGVSAGDTLVYVIDILAVKK